MPLPLEKSDKAGIVRRAKALAFLLLPLLLFAAVVFLSFSLQRRLGTPRQSRAAQPSGDDLYSVRVENGSTPQVAGSTSVTTYVVTGTY